MFLFLDTAWAIELFILLFFFLQISEEDFMLRLKLQQQELERCVSLQQQLNAALNEIERLKKQGSSFASPELK